MRGLKILGAIAAALTCTGVIYAAVNTNATPREIRDPIKFRALYNENTKVASGVTVTTAATNNQELTSATKVHVIGATSAITCTVANAVSIGQELVLVNASNVLITVLDSGNWEGVASLGQEDTHSAVALSTGQWVKQGGSNNTP